MRREFPCVRILFLWMLANEGYVAQALKIGADGYVLKRADHQGELELAVRCAKRGGKHSLTPAILKKVLSGHMPRLKKDRESEWASNPYEVLTPRQREIPATDQEGFSTKRSPRSRPAFNTVAVHRANLMDRLDIHDLARLVRYAIESGIAWREDE